MLEETWARHYDLPKSARFEDGLDIKTHVWELAYMAR